MKKMLIYVFLLSVMIIILPKLSFSQSVAINADSSKADASAILDLKSTKKGLLVPRMTMAQRDLIASPATGLLIYQTDVTPGYYYYTGSLWSPLKSTDGGSGTGNYWSANDGDDIFNTNIGNVGIGTVLPTSKLTVKTPLNTTGFKHIGVTDSIGSDSVVVTENIGGISASIGTATAHPFRFITNNTGRMTIDNIGNVIIGDNNAFAVGKLTMQTEDYAYGMFQRGASGGLVGTYVNPTQGGVGTFSNTDMALYVGGLYGMIIQKDTRNIGVAGEINPINKFQIGSVGAAGYNGNDLAIGNGTNAFGIAQTNNITQIGSSTNIGFIPKNGSGNVGIDELNPINKLQIGSMGAVGYNGNDFAFGNGAQATAFAQTNGFSQIASSTNIALLPKYGVGGSVGINTAFPRAPLDVEGTIGYSPSYYYFYNGNGVDEAGGCFGCTANTSIYASAGIMATEFDAFSDARIKNEIGVSNTAKDLQIINALQITDYTFKDKIKNGSKLYKKVIAQQVETVYPQVVSKHVDFVPNVYQLTNKIEKTANGYLLSFAGNHNISKDAKKLQIIMEENSGKKEFTIVSIPSLNQVIINATDLKANKLFVYGEEVNDFRTVDYEGLTTLNISATQELSKQVTELQKTVAEQKEQIEALLKAVNAVKHPEITKK